jgi:hypothetical protein
MYYISESAEENSKLYTSPKFTASLCFKKENRGYLFTTFVQVAVFSFKAGQERNLLINFELFLCAPGVCNSLLYVYVKRDTNPFRQTASDKKRERESNLRQI